VQTRKFLTGWRGAVDRGYGLARKEKRQLREERGKMGTATRARERLSERNASRA